MALFLGFSLQAQITIGTNNDPHTGAVLDLQSSNMGLLLSRVALKENPTWFALDFGAAEDTVAVKLAAEGMLVYNIADVQSGEGLYVWDGEKWNPLFRKPSFSVNLTTSSTTIAENSSLVCLLSQKLKNQIKFRENRIGLLSLQVQKSSL